MSSDERDRREQRNLSQVMSAILDGDPIDWSDVDSTTPQQDRGLVTQLRTLAALSDFYRGLPAPGVTQTVPAGTMWGHLRVDERIGVGAFGEVFRAWDTRLDRAVALKLLRPNAWPDADTTSGIVAEGRLLARVRHPNVVTVYGAERIGAQIGLWMELLHGRTLAEEVRSGGPLAAEDVLDIARVLCRAFNAVHGAGLVHCDVKAQNVMRETGGRIVLMDFGAGADAWGDPSDYPPAGTPLYAAPEILDGGTVSIRSDLYSLGVLLYHISTGGYPVNGANLSEIRRAHRAQHRTALRQARPDLPSTLLDAVDRALSTEPDDRFESAAAFEAALTPATGPRSIRLRIAGVAIAVALGLAALVGIRRDGDVEARLRFEPRDSVLITKFENRTGESVFDGAVEYAIQRALSESDVVRLVPEERVGDALQLMKRRPDTVIDRIVGREVALRDGRIKVLLAGRIEKFGSAYVVTAQLIDPADDAVVATIGEQARGPEGVLHALGRQASRVRLALGENHGRLRGADANIESATTSSLEAFQLYNQSYQLGRQGKWPAALEVARQMVAVDPEFASGWIWLAWALRNSEGGGAILSPSDTRIARYREFAARALRLADRGPEWERHWITGSYYTLTGEAARAIPHYQALIRLRPDHYYVYNNLIASLLIRRGPEDHREYLAVAQHIGDQRPNEPALLANAAAAAAREKGNAAAAQRYLDRLKALMASNEPLASDARFHHDFANAYISWNTGDFRQTLEHIHAMAERYGGYPQQRREETLAGLLGYYLSLGRMSDASRLVASLKAPSDVEFGRYVLAWETGDRALLRQSLLQRAATPRNPWWFHGPAYVKAGLHDHARRYVEEQASVLEGIARIANGQLRLIDNKPSLAIPDLQRGLQLTLTNNHPAYWWGCASLADTQWHSRRDDEAIATLEECARNEFKAVVVWAPLGATRAQLDLYLADLYRRVGRVASARQVEDQLRRRLALADADWPMLQVLRRRAETRE